MSYETQRIIVLSLGFGLMIAMYGFSLVFGLKIRQMNKRIKSISNVKYNVDKFDEIYRKRSLNSWWRVNR